MKAMKISILMLVIVTVMGCVIERRNPSHVKYFLLDVQRSNPQTQIKPDVCMRIRPCRVTSSFAGRSLVYRTADVQYEQDYYNLFLTDPENQITDILYSWFRRAGFDECIAGIKSGVKLYNLETRVDTLCADFTDKAAPVAVVTVHISVTRFDKDNAEQSIVLAKTYTANEPLPATPAATDVVEGLSQALTQILQQLEEEIAGLM